jgi:ribosome-associated heat shock protein Hsp15
LSQRLDKWLVYARFVKHRSTAAGLVEAGHVRVNKERASKPHQNVKASDVLTLTLGSKVRVIRVLGEAERRGPASTASLLYEELGAPEL